MPTIGAGDLRQRVRFDKRREDAGDGGGRTETDWIEQFTRWASVKYRPGGETVMAQRLTGNTPADIIVRFDSDTKCIDTAWRAVLLQNGEPSVYFGLKSVADMDMTRKFVTILGVAGAADA